MIGENSSDFLNFVSKKRSFESKEWLDSENYSDDKSIIAIIVFGG